MICALCAREIVNQDEQENGYCLTCSLLIYKNNDKAKYVKALEKAKKHCPAWLVREIEELTKDKPPFDFEEKEKK